jgi:small subunit ribosomal protein S17
MADEEKNEQNEEPTADPDTPVDARARDSATRDTGEDVSADTEAEEQQAEETPTEAPEEEAPAEEQPGEEPAEEGGEQAPAEEPAGDSDTPAGEAEDVADDALEGLDWKARRRLERSRLPSESQPERSPEERAQARRERRRAAAARRRAYRGRARERRKGAGQGTPPAERTSVAAKVRQGRVISNKADKTITVRIDTARRHPSYEKVVRRSNTLHAHDERNEAGEGDLVRLVETRPISRTKRWRLAEIVEKAK